MACLAPTAEDRRIDPARPSLLGLTATLLPRNHNPPSASPQPSPWTLKPQLSGAPLPPAPRTHGFMLPFAAASVASRRSTGSTGWLLAVAKCDAGAPSPGSLGSPPPALVFSAQPGGVAPWWPGASRRGYHEARVEVNEWGERMVPELKPILAPFYPNSLLNTALRCALLAYLPLLEQYLPQEDLGEEDLREEEPSSPGEEKHRHIHAHLNAQDRDSSQGQAAPRPPLDLVKPAYRAFYSMLRELGVQVIRKLVERFVVQFVEPHTGWELTKDTFKSAKRKAKYRSKSMVEGIRRTGDVFVETFKGHVLGSVASLFVQLKIDFVGFLRYFYSHRKAIRHRPQLLQQQLVCLQRRVLAHSIKALGALLGASAGAALGSAVWPGHGYVVGFTLGDMLGAAGVNKFVDPLVVQMQKDFEAEEIQKTEDEAEAERKAVEEEPEKEAKAEDETEKKAAD